MRIVAHTQYTVGSPTLPKQFDLDLFGDEEIVIKYEVDNIREANSKNSSYSKSYDIPATKNNNKFFRHIYDLQSDMKGAPNGVLNAFNPYKSCDVEVYAEGSLILEGVMFLNSIKESDVDFTYNVTIYSKVVGFLDALGEATIGDLDFADIAHDKTLANIKSSFTGDVTLSAGGTTPHVFYPLTDDGLIGYDTLAAGTLDIDSRFNFPPFVSIKYILDKMFDYAGYSFESTILSSTEFAKIFMDSGCNSEYSALTEYGDVNVNAASDYAIPNNGAFNDLIFTSETADANNLHNTSTGLYTAPDDNLDVSCACSLWVANANASARTIYIRLVHNSTVPSQSPSSIIHTQTIPANSTVQVFAYANVLLNNAETVKFTIGTTGSDVSVDASYTIPTTSTSVSSNYYFFTNSASGGNYVFQHNRADIKLADIFKDLTKMFNLIIETDENNPKKLLIQTFNDFVAAGTEHDWSKKVDRSEMNQDMFDLPRKLTFAMARDDEDYFLNFYEGILGKEYGIQEINIDVETDKEEEIRLDVFAPTALVKQHPDYAPISVITSSSDGNVFERYSNKPRLHFKNSVTHNAPFGIFDQMDIYEGSFGAQETLYSTSHHYEDDTSVLLSDDSNLLFGNVGFIFHDVTTVPLKTFYNLYWEDYVKERYVNLSHLLKVRVYLKSEDINQFSFADTVRIDNQIYRVNSIEYTTGAEKLAKVELYKL